MTDERMVSVPRMMCVPVSERIEDVTGRTVVVGDVVRLADAWGMGVEDTAEALSGTMGNLDFVLLPELCSTFGVSWEQLLGL